MPTTKPDNAPVIRIDRSTLVPIGLLITVVGSAIGATLWLQGTMLELVHNSDKSTLKLEQQIQGVKSDVRLLTQRVEAADGHQFTSSDMKRWCELLSANNPDLKVPEPVHR